jgi:hypothetical protein
MNAASAFRIQRMIREAIAEVDAMVAAELKKLNAAARGIEHHPGVVELTPEHRARLLANTREIVGQHRARLLAWRAESLATLQSRMLGVIGRLH